jgi:hypothetical protein
MGNERHELYRVCAPKTLGIQYDLEVENALNEKDYSNFLGRC